MVATRDEVRNVWGGIRSAFIERVQKPTYAELAEEFKMPLGTLSRVAADEGWVLQRAQRIEKVAIELGAAESMIELSQGNREVAATFINICLVGVKRLTRVIEGIEEGTKARAETDIIQNCSFAAANFAKSLKELGVCIIPKSLAEGLEGKGSRDFLKGALNQINVSVSLAQKDGAAVTVNETQAPYSAKPAESAPASEELPPA